MGSASFPVSEDRFQICPPISLPFLLYHKSGDECSVFFLKVRVHGTRLKFRISTHLIKRPTALLCQAIFVGARRSIGAPILFKILILYANHTTIQKFWVVKQRGI